ncbi:hypothetical protein BDB01DRAFT_704682, partial [Pilobolus umbonatus]
FVWRVTYVCHRSGKYKSIAATNASVKDRPALKESKKMGCPARLIVRCPRSDTENVIIEYEKDHSHEVGTLEDTGFLPLSSTMKQ